MNLAGRKLVFATGALGAAAVFACGALGLPGMGEAGNAYSELLIRLSLVERHVTDAVTGVNFDLRAIDTLGEEFILFVSVMGALVVLREVESPQGGTEGCCRGRPRVPISDALSIWSRLLVGPCVLFALSVIAHGQLTPGGGFQGGVILATVPLVIYLAGEQENFHGITSHRLAEAAESAAAASFALIGFWGLLQGGAFLENPLPPGQTGQLLSGGFMPLISAVVGMEVGTGGVLLLSAFLQETLS